MPLPIFRTPDGDLTVLPTWGTAPGAVVSLRIPGNSTQALVQLLSLDQCQELGNALLAHAVTEADIWTPGPPRPAEL